MKESPAHVDLFEKCRRFTRATEVKALGIYPYFQPISANFDGTEVIVHGKRMIMVGSNNYLGLTHDPRVKEAAIHAIKKYGSGCTGSRFLNGTLDLHVHLEERLARFSDKEAAITFSTGFQTNLGTISSLAGKGDIIFCDRENHASIIDGARLSFGETRKFRHNDIEELERLLEQASSDAGKLIVVDGVFSMTGAIANLPEIVRLASNFGARILVDDAHSIGVLGDHGRGTTEYYDLEDKVDIVMGTFSKSFASIGGFITGPKDVIDYIKHNARPLIFSASIPPPAAASVVAALDIIETEPERRTRLWKNTEKMKREFMRLGFRIGEPRTPIIPIMIGDEMKTFAFWKRLFEEGVFTNPVIQPAVPPHKALIRTSYMSTHEDSQLDRVLDVFERVGRELLII